uniref:Protein FAR1-RELATED SEQUENCE n=1 Tax=Setaria viridis TaxID=4556 RepID=A0A4U6WAA6_SETVI|nr:protein FAR1-RELATED SEQUENCE 5-like isoform X1 [Setaria viridis]TKW39607.1 hypothetical protein SEVIR_1G190800v2 [Setaria viridis]TKW39608.1 hypothetical protein SEVIR_1G190800v2 [Setaria viridis]
MGSTSREPPPDPPAPPPARAGDTEARRSIASLQEAAGDYTPRLGREFDSELEAYEFYLNYAWKVGFTVRREYANKSRKNGEISSSKYVCSREGFKSMDKRTNRSKTPQPDTRTGCKACLTVRHNNDSTKYEVYGFEPKHNHPLVVPSCANPLQRKLVDIQSAQANNSSNVTSACEPESRNSVIGDNAVTSREWQRPLRIRRQREIEYGEAAALLNYLQDQSRADPLFYHAVQLDTEDKVANIFWADVKMITDFSQFGDVVSFDIVSRDSMDLRPFASFVGFNNYGETVLLGMALMYDGTVESFHWLFDTFLNAMSGCAPRTIFYRQDAYVGMAISMVMPDTCHALCTWHLKQTAKSNINYLIKRDCDFMKEFKACINYYEEERELFTSWEVMINKYSLHGNVWLQKVFEEKEKWAGPYMKWTFSAGMKNTQLNERLHSDVGDYLRTDVDITLFMKHLQKVVDDRRYTELEIEFSSKLKLPDFKIRAPILIQASEAYTDMIFQLFQEEYEEFQSAYIVSHDESGPCREYIVAILDKERKHKVYGNPSEQTVLCSCRKFETLGFLCSHALKILDTMDIKYLPHRYILKRWTKYARCLTSQVDDRKVQEDTTLEFSNRYQYLCPVFARLVARASVCEESYRALEQCSVEMSKKVEGIIWKQTSIDASACEPDTVDIQISLSVSATDNESEHAMNYSSNKRAKKTKKKGHKDKSQTRSCIKKGLQNKKTLQLEQPAVQFFMLDTPTQTVQDSLRVISALSFIIVVDLHYMSLVVEHCARIYDEKYPCVNPH